MTKEGGMAGGREIVVEEWIDACVRGILRGWSGMNDDD